MTDGPKIKLTIPRQDLERFDLFPLTPEAAKKWADSLPAVNTMTSVPLLIHALADINHIRLAPESRFEVLETLRPNLSIALTSLSKRYLNQPLVMPEEPANMAALAEELLTLACTAYTVVAVETIREQDAIAQVHPAKLACEAIEHALQFASLKVLHCLQLYRPLPILSWHTLHQLFALAQDQQLQDLPVQGSTPSGRTIKSTYLQAVILSCSKPNQLRQIDLATIHHALAAWSELVDLDPPVTNPGLFAVELTSDQPPLYASLWADSSGDSRHTIGTERLLDHLRTLKEQGKSDSSLEQDIELAPHLLDHLIHALGSMSLRNFTRTPNHSTLRVCLGLSSTHFHVAGRTDFASLIAQSNNTESYDTAIFRSPDKADVWADLNPTQEIVGNAWLPGQDDTADGELSHELDARTRDELLEEVEVQLPIDQRYPIHKVQLADVSPGGYCLRWSNDTPGEVNTGDIVSLKEDDGSHWSIAVVRWLRRPQSTHTLIGLELLSPNAEALGAQAQTKDAAASPAVRVLLLPEIKLVGQAPTLITPRTGFREGQRITLLGGQESLRVQLTRQRYATASYSQFEFERVKEISEVLSDGNPTVSGSSYDSVWSHI